MNCTQILDATASFRSQWFTKTNPNTIYMDIRTQTQINKDAKATNLTRPLPKLTLTCDFTKLPFKNETFHHICFDPPHLLHLLPTSIFYKKYGVLRPETWQYILKSAVQELWRVLAVNGTLTFKWSDYNLPHKQVLAVLPVKPLYGQVSAGTRTKRLTKWYVFVKTTGEKN
ncbi:SAM-dependent methyltransferase [Candidatus Bathycorpusculum sp.]|uniref:SAM-dependent methyltransferase n=1 Tax=Candidatus Bathycorpusculum sp. TaxID=2994959 RepID=UPI002829C2FD|nr:SAM-dependent methyltransferase [Candidatus Termitimicrobium sp.]MCL2685952.1 SAM-dependent methyltransferase [Candidatus Termitimicrobium sp.]